MATFTVRLTVGTSGATFPRGPYTYKVKVINPCTPVTFTDGNGNTVTNEVTISSPNPSREIVGTFDDSLCSAANLGTIEATVVGQDACAAISSKSLPNPCYQLTANMTVGTFGGTSRTFLASANKAAKPLTFKWEVLDTPEVFITSSNSLATVTVRDDGSKAYRIKCTITDANGCSVEVIRSITPVIVNPVLQNFNFQLVTGSVAPVVIDLRVLASDADGYVDYSQTQFVTNPTKGTNSLDSALGIITYTPTAAQTGTDVFQVRVRDNNGNYSNTANFSITHTPGKAVPTLVGDTVTTAWNTPVTIDVFANDTDADNNIDRSSLLIILQPLNGVAEVTSDFKIKYTPNSGFTGTDVIRYSFLDTDGNAPTQNSMNSVAITVSNSCDNHSGDIQIVCTEDVGFVQFVASAIGQVSSVGTSTIEVNTGSGYSAGSLGTIPISCSSPAEVTLQPAGLGSVTLGNETRLNLTGTNYRFRLAYATPISSSIASQIQSFLESYREENEYFHLELTDSSGGALTEIMKDFFGAAVTIITSTTNYLELVFSSTRLCTGQCATAINTVWNAALTKLAAANNNNVRLQWIKGYRYGAAANTVRFKRTITRSNGCPNIVIEKLIELTGTESVCANQRYNVTVLQSGGGTGQFPAVYPVYQALFSVVGVNSISNITVNSSTNILDRAYNPNTELVALEARIQTWLDANGGGAAGVYVSTSQIVFSIATTQIFNTVTHNLATVNFALV